MNQSIKTQSNTETKRNNKYEAILPTLAFTVGIIICYFMLIHKNEPIREPQLSIANHESTKEVDGTYIIDKNITEDIFIKTNLDNESNKLTKVNINGIVADPCDRDEKCDFKFRKEKLGEKRGSTYLVSASNSKGESSVIIKFENVKKKEDDNYTSHERSKYPHYSEKETKRLVAHMVCKNHIKRYFSPYDVKIHSILGVGRDFEFGVSWVYGVDITVKNPYGEKTTARTTCAVAHWENLSSGPYDGATGSVISFKIEPYE